MDRCLDGVRQKLGNLFAGDATKVKDAGRSRVLMQTHDLKARMWAKSARDYGLEITPVAYSMIYSPMLLLGEVIKGRRPKAFVFRYLNDYPSFTKTCLRYIAEWLLLCMCNVLSIETHWICHNVDRESLEYHPAITKRRRAMLLDNVETVFVTDERLMEPARSHLAPSENKLDWICFGKLCQSYDRENTASREIVEFISEHREREKAALAGLWVGVPFSGKKQHALEMIPRIVGCDEGPSVVMIVIGPLSENVDTVGRAIIEGLERNESVFLLDRYVEVRREPVVEDVDFFWKGVGDFSIPLTLYHAMSLGKPLLVPSGEFLSQYVAEEGIGWFIEEDAENLTEATRFVKRWDSRLSRDFLLRHGWRRAARRLSSRIAG